MLARVSGKTLEVSLADREHGDVANTGAAISRARADLDFEPSTSLEEGLLAEYEWAAGRRAAPSRFALTGARRIAYCQTN